MRPKITVPEQEHAAGDFTRAYAHAFERSALGARLARHAVLRRLSDWGWPRDTDTAQTTALVVAELVANAVRHGDGPDLRLRLLQFTRPAMLRIEVTDDLDTAPPPESSLPPTTLDSGRGLFLIDAVAAGRGVRPNLPQGKTVWVDVPCGGSSS